MAEVRDIKIEKQKGSEPVFRRFMDQYNQEWKLFQNTEPNRFAKIVAEWLPTLLGYYDESENAKSSLQILEDTLREATDNTIRSKAILEGLYDASLRTTKKDSPSVNFYKTFLDSRRLEIFDDATESASVLGTEAPGVIWRYNGDFQSELALGIVKKEIKNASSSEIIEALRKGLLISVLVEIDFPEFRKGLEDSGVTLIDD